MNDFTSEELAALVSIFRQADVHPDDDNIKGDLYTRLLEAQQDRAELDAFSSDCGDACKL